MPSEIIAPVTNSLKVWKLCVREKKREREREREGHTDDRERQTDRKREKVRK